MRSAAKPPRFAAIEGAFWTHRCPTLNPTPDEKLRFSDETSKQCGLMRSWNVRARPPPRRRSRILPKTEDEDECEDEDDAGALSHECNLSGIGLVAI